MIDDDWTRLGIRAATIDELLSPEYAPTLGDKESAKNGAERLAAWCGVAANGDWTFFARRLARDGLTFPVVLERLGRLQRDASVAAPTWLADAQWVVAALGQPASRTFEDGLLVRAEPLAFEQLLARVVEEAHARLLASIGDNAGRGVLSETAWLDICRYLLKRLSRVCEQAFYDAFTQIRASSALAPASAEGGSLYERFVEDMRRDGARRLFAQKPVLLRLMASVTRQWLDAEAEFLMRWRADEENVSRRLLPAQNLRVVERVQCQMGDLHNGGRSVHLLRFGDGSAILYKPRDLRLDAIWRELVENLNERAPTDLRVPDVLPRNGYGWVEYITYADCGDDDAAERFFQRAGAWLCLFHLFAASDMHEENMIAAGEHPVPIDFETLFQPSDLPTVAEVPARRGYELATERVADSVLSTGLLPAYGRTPENRIVAHGGLIDPARRNVERAWEHPNTDNMKRVAKIVVEDALSNIPSVKGRRANITEFSSALAHGYRTYANFLLEEKPTIARAFDKCAGLRVRKLLRHTRFYAMLLERITHPRNFDDGAKWSADLDFVARLMDWDREKDPWWPLLKAERASLSDLNIPHFTASTDADDMGDDKGSFSRSETRPGLARARERLDLLSPDFIDWQCALIDVSTSTIQGNRTTRLPAGRALSPVSTAPSLFLERATAIRDHIAGLACRTADSAGWIGLDWLRDSVVCQLSPLGADFYNGSTGIATFFAAHAKATGSAFSAEMGLAALAPVRQDLKGLNATRAARSLGIGGSVGLGSVVYAFTVIGQLLDDLTLLDDARHVASHITDALIASDKHLDVMEGAAGAILGLLKLYRATGDSEVLNRAVRCGAHLLASRRVRQDGPLGWGAPELNGMSHGAAGFAYALSALAPHAPTQSGLLEAADDCLRFEDRSFSIGKGNWPDLRNSASSDGDFWPCQWCHGAGGIGLARLGIMQELSTFPTEVSRKLSEAAETGLARAIEAAKRAWPYPTDTLCCGNLGNIELLSDAASTTGQRELETIAHDRMRAIVQEADARGDYVWDISDKRFNIGLFRGLSGVGYSLLRRADDSLPNILLWR